MLLSRAAEISLHNESVLCYDFKISDLDLAMYACVVVWVSEWRGVACCGELELVLVLMCL